MTNRVLDILPVAYWRIPVHVNVKRKNSPIFRCLKKEYDLPCLVLQVRVFEDEDGIRREEIAALQGKDIFE